jgi:hypothetical protein
MRFRMFLQAQTGAVAVDWVVLTATALGFGLMLVTALSGGVVDMAGDIGATLTNAGVMTLGAP